MGLALARESCIPLLRRPVFLCTAFHSNASLSCYPTRGECLREVDHAIVGCGVRGCACYPLKVDCSIAATQPGEAATDVPACSSAHQAHAPFSARVSIIFSI